MTDLLTIYEVAGDPETGEWLHEPRATADYSTKADWNSRVDTDDLHYETYEHGDPPGSETRLDQRPAWIRDPPGSETRLDQRPAWIRDPACACRVLDRLTDSREPPATIGVIAMTTHTYSPWIVSSFATDTPDAPGTEQQAVVSANGLPLAILPLRGTATIDNYNATLIAYAPDMLGALEWIDALISRQSGVTSNDLDMISNRITQLIAKAKRLALSYGHAKP